MERVKEFIKKPQVIFSIILLIIFIIVLIVPARRLDIFKKSGYSKIESISKMATIETYYHNVAIKENEASGLGKIFFNVGYKKIWYEYEGTVKFGVDAKKIKISKPNSKGVVKVYIPKAEIIGEPNIILDSMQDPVTETGFLTSVSAKEKAQAISYAQEKMKEEAEKDSEILALAHERAKKLIENYIIETGNSIGEKYTVEFVESDDIKSVFE